MTTPTHENHILYRILMGLSILCIIAACYYGLRLSTRYKHGPPPLTRETDISTIALWMTIPHISRVYGVPETDLRTGLQLDPDLSRRANLAEIARSRGATAEAMLQSVRSYVRDFQSRHARPPTPIP